MRVVRHNKGRDRTIDLTRQITPQANHNREFVIPVADDIPYARWMDEDAPLRVGYDTVHVPFERYSTRKWREEVVKTETWGEETIEFVDQWWETFTWLGVKHEEVRVP